MINQYPYKCDVKSVQMRFQNDDLDHPHWRVSLIFRRKINHLSSSEWIIAQHWNVLERWNWKRKPLKTRSFKCCAANQFIIFLQFINTFKNPSAVLLRAVDEIHIYGSDDGLRMFIFTPKRDKNPLNENNKKI